MQPAKQQNSSPFCQLPADVLFTIFEYLKPSDILALRLCCREFLDLTQERSIWVKILKEQRHNVPMPPEVQFHDLDASDAFRALETQDLLRLALHVQRADRLWPQPRARPPITLERHPNASILLGMQMFLDRWLLVTYAEGFMQLYDAHSPVPGLLAGHYSSELGGTRGSWSSFSAAADPTNGVLIIATARSVPPYLLNVFRVNLKGNVSSEETFVLVKQVTLESPKTVRAIDPALGVLAVSASSKVQLVNWSDPDGKHGDFAIPAYQDDPDDLWDGINVVRFIGPYLLVARTRSIEFQHFLSAFQPTVTRRLPALKHNFRMCTFKEAAFSECKERQPHATGRNFEIVMLAYDVIQGLFQFKVELFVPHPTPQHTSEPLISLDSAQQPKLRVTQIGLYPLGLPHPASNPQYNSSSNLTMPHHSLSHSPTIGNDSPTPTFSHTHFIQNLGHLAHGTSTMTSRGFLSAFSMGAQGLRAVWVERRRGGVAREIQVWGQSMAADAKERSSSDWVFQFGADTMEMEKKVVYTISSYDLRDDILCCAFSESMGVIALGNRLGNVSILPLE